jgi:hypothetical protein
MTDLPAEIQRIIDRLDVERLLAAYTAYGDAGRIEEFAALFAEDGVLELQGERRMTGPAEVGAFARETGRRLSAVPGLLPGGHHVSSRLIEPTGPDQATSSSVFLFVGTSGVDHWGTYRDRLVRTSAGWRFAHRSVRVTGYAPGSPTPQVTGLLTRGT